VLHEVRRRQTQLGAVAQVDGVLLVAGTGGPLQAGIRAGDAILDGLIHLYLAHRFLVSLILVTCVLLHNTPFFYVVPGDNLRDFIKIHVSPPAFGYAGHNKGGDTSIV
jgi:hypothetical protein